MGMKLLLIGGSGGLSGCLARMAVEKGHEVWAVTRGKRSLPEGVHSLIADRGDEASFARSVEEQGIRWDAAIDCICMNAAHAAQDLEVLPRVTHRLAVVSTDSVYDPLHKEVPQAEETLYYERGNDYAGNKRRMEEAFLGCRAPGLDWTIFRPGHIYGPGFELGCFPEHSRQPDLLRHIRADQPVRLVGGGTYLTQPVFVEDLAASLLDCLDKPDTFGEIFCIGGPKAVPNREYYSLIGHITGHPVTFVEIPEEGYREAHPEFSGHLCQRCYRLGKLAGAGVRLPDTSLEEGLKRHIAWLDSIASDAGRADI